MGGSSGGRKGEWVKDKEEKYEEGRGGPFSSSGKIEAVRD